MSFYDGVVLCAPFSLVPERRSQKSTQRLAFEVLEGVLGAAKLDRDQLDGLSLSSLTLAPDTVAAFCEHAGLSCRYLDGPPFGGASAIAAVRRAARMVAAGDVDHVAIIGADRNDGESFGDLVQNFSRFSQAGVWPYGAGGPNAVFALITRHYMDLFGATRDDFGALAVSQRANAKDVPHAVFRDKTLSLDDYQRARIIADPLCLYDCVMPVAGGEGFVVMREVDARAAGLPFARILSTMERHNAFADDLVQLRGGWALDRERLWSEAGLSPAEISCVETYDDYPVMSLIQLEDLGFCDKGAGAELVRSRDLTRAGDLPHNTSGGQLSAGQAGAAGGHLGVVEALRQVTGQAPGWAVAGATSALVSGFGMATYDRGLCATAMILTEGTRK